MPELPEVETTVRGLNRVLTGKKIVDVWSVYRSAFHLGKKNIKDPAYFLYFKKHIVGKKVTHVSRRAKNILIHLDDETKILVHMKMTGHFLYGKYIYNKKNEVWRAQNTTGPLADPFNQHIRFVLTINDENQLAFSDMRKFAKITLVEKERRYPELEFLGPEPIDPTFNHELFATQLRKRPKAIIKKALLDQDLVSGIGNIYSDEILWASSVHPERFVKDISTQEMKILLKNTKEILNRSIDLGGDSMSDFRNIDGNKGGFHPYHKAYKRNGKKCTKKNCTGIIKRIKINSRGAHFCPKHQK